MVIEHIYNMVSMVLNKDRRGFVKRTQKTLAIKQAMYDHFNAEVEIYRKTGIIPASVRKFVKTANIVLTNGSGPMPADFSQDLTGETSCGRELTILKQEEWMDRMHSEILAPDQENPIAKIEDDKIFVQPDEFTGIKLTYFRLPDEFVYAVTVAGDGRSESFSSAGSTDIEFGIDHSKEIIRRALVILGVSFQNREAFELALNDNQK